MKELTVYHIRANLANAARLLRQNGWWSGFEARGPKGQMCTLTAITTAAEEDYLGPTASYFRRQIGGTSIAAWNSEEDQTEEKVLAILDRLSQVSEEAPEEG